MPELPAVEERGPFRILRHGGTSWLACTRCPDPLVEMAVDGDATEQHLAKTMDQHQADAHPPTILGHLSDAPIGWHDLLLDLHAKLLELDPGYRIDGLKEKFGELRVSMVSGEPPEIEAVLDAATEQSRKMCVFCGAEPATMALFATGTYPCCESHPGTPFNA